MPCPRGTSFAFHRITVCNSSGTSSMFRFCCMRSWVLLCTAMCVLAAVARAANMTVSTQEGLREALINPDYELILIIKPLEINSSTWRNVEISRSVTIRSPTRVILDLCDAACNDGTMNRTEPFITVVQNGDVVFNRIFLRNFLPTQPLAPWPYEDPSSPVPGIVCRGTGRVSFRLVVWHFLRENLYAFDQNASPYPYWVSTANVMKTPSYARNLDISRPDIYFFKSHQTTNSSNGGTYTILDSFAPVDPLGCLGGDEPVASNTTLVYCPYSTKDALSNPYVNTIYVHHNVGLDTLFYSYWDPVLVNRTVNIRPCPMPEGEDITIDSDFVHSSVVITGPGAVTYDNLRFAVSASGHRPQWPSENPLLLSIYDVRQNGRLTFRNSRFAVTNLTQVKSQLDKLPSDGWQPNVPNLAPVYASTPTKSALQISSWEIVKGQWLTWTTGSLAVGNGDVSSWKFENVTVQRAQLPCFHGPILQGALRPDQVVNVTDEPSFYAALNNNTGARYVQLLADLKLTGAFWAGKQQLQVQSLVEIRACHPAHGMRYTLDFSNLDSIIRVASGRMSVEGDIDIRGLGWRAMGERMVRLISAVQVAPGAVLEVQYVRLHGEVPPRQAGEAWVQGGLQIVEAAATSTNVIATGPWHLELGLYYVQQPATAGSPSDVPSGQWSLTNVKIYWQGTSGRAVPLAAIVAPVVVGSALLAVSVAFFVAWRRRRGAQQPAPQGGKYHAASDGQSSYGGTSSGTFGKSMFNGMVIHAGSNLDGSSGFNSDSTMKQRSGPGQDIEAACRDMVGARVGAQGGQETVVLEGLLGEGSYGKVYKATWKGTVVAVKVMVLPSYMSGKEKREKMAIMETAISSLLSHPNIVQTYTYSVEPVMGNSKSAASTRSGTSLSLHDSTLSLLDNTNGVHSWEVRLVQEFCDLGSLRDVLNAHKGLRRPGDAGGAVDMLAVLDTALDIARAMAHLHSENIIHSDLKARNVLLKSAPTDARGFIAKVADFGLSLKMDVNDTHISNAYQGTLTHMAPETLMRGHLSKASDVYAFGILLWEAFSGGHAFKGTPKALLGHSITKGGLRPQFDADCPFEYQFLACRCWESDPSIRPSFEQILEELKRIKRRLSGAREDGSESSYNPMGSVHSGSSWQPGTQQQQPNLSISFPMAEAQQRQQQGDMAIAVPGSAAAATAAQLLVSGSERSTYVDGSTFMQSLLAGQQPGHTTALAEAEEEEGEGEEMSVARSTQASMEPQHLV